MSTAPLVSVIVRTKNRPHTLAEALASLIAQRHRPIEVLLVNDGGVAVDELAANLGTAGLAVRMIRNPVSLGRCAAANQGLDAAQGEFLALLDDDDWLEPEQLSRLLERLMDGEGARVAYAQVRFCAGPEAPTEHLFANPFDPVQLMLENYIPIHAVLFHRSLVAEQGCRFDESLAVFEDWDFWLQLARHGAFLYEPSLGAGYRSGGMSGAGWSQDPDAVRAARVRLVDKWRHLWPAEDLDQALRWNRDTWLAELASCRAAGAAIWAEHDKLSNLHSQLIQSHQELEREYGGLLDGHEKLHHSHRRLEQFHADLIHAHQGLEQLHQQLVQDHRILDQAHRELLASTSWKLTEPLRWLARKFATRG